LELGQQIETSVGDQPTRKPVPKRAESRNAIKLKEIERLTQLTEVLELMEETHKDKNWIMERIRANHLKISLKPSMGSVGILKACPPNFIFHLLGLLKFSEIDVFEGPPPLTTTYHWFFTDIVASSDPTITTNEQARKIIVLNKLIERTEVFRRRDPDSTLILPTGDGMAIGFSDSPEKPLLLALELHKDLSRYNTQKTKERDRLYLRIGLDSGPVYIIEDLNGKENVWGPGIIMARRVMDLARDMNIIASSKIANDIRTLRPEYKNIMHPIGDYSLKHGLKILIYNVYGEGFGNKKAPTSDKVQKSTASDESLKTVNRFIYGQIQIILEIKDISNMMTHHHMNWNLVNISDQPVDRIFYYLDGDVPRNFPDMNVVVKDEENQELEMISLNVNKPYHKEFYIRLRKPLKPRQKGRWVNLEYDWEEPDRHYFYRCASNCNKFSYSLTAPKALQINQKVVYVDVESGEKRYAKIPAAVKYLEDKTQITWEATKLAAHDAYRFDW
jgi:hypothetical protein